MGHCASDVQMQRVASASDSDEEEPIICDGLASDFVPPEHVPPLDLRQMYDMMILGVPMQLLRIIMLMYHTIQACCVNVGFVCAMSMKAFLCVQGLRTIHFT